MFRGYFTQICADRNLELFLPVGYNDLRHGTRFLVGDSAKSGDLLVDEDEEMY